MPDRSVVYRLRADVTQFRAQMASAAASVKGAADKMTAADKSGSQFRKGLTTLGSAAGKVGLVAAAGLGAALVQAANFDQAMSRVSAATHESASNMALLRTAAVRAGQETVFSATDAAGAITEMAKAGVKTGDILGGGLKGALSLASAGELEVGQAAEIAATALNQFGLAGSDIPHVADLLAAGAGKAQGEVSDFAEALKYVGPVAHQMGVSIEETTGTIAELATQGILGEQAGTGLRGMLLSLSSPSAIASKKMQQLGIDVYDAQGKFIGFNGIAGQLHEALSGLTAAERDEAFGRIFGNAQITTARILYAGGASAVDKWTKNVDDSGYAADTAARKMDNLKGDLNNLGSALETALIGAGESSQGPLRKIVQGLTEATNAFSSLPGPAKTAATGLLAVTAVLGAGVWAGAKIVEGVASMRTALTTLGFTAETTRAKLALIGGGAAAATLGIGTLIDTISQMDSLSRSGDAADVTVKSFQDLSDALSYSNVGKYADDLHINLGRLTEDLYKNGAQGEYAKKVIDQLSDSSHGFNAALGDYTSIIPFYQAGTQKAGEASKDLGNIIKNNSDALGAGEKATDSATAATKLAAVAAQQNAAALKASRTAAAETAQSFLNLSKNATNAKVSLNGWLRQLANQTDALRNFTNNATIAANRGLRDGLIKYLQKMGPEGALRMKQLANASDRELKRANQSWSSWSKTSRQATDAVGGGVNQTKAKVGLLRAEIARLKDKKITVDDKGTSAKIQARIRALQATINNLHGASITNTVHTVHLRPENRADGGYISGPGGPREDRIPAMLSNGEFVVNAAATARNLSLLHSINAQKFAMGGRVGFANGGEARSDDGHTTLRDRIRKLTAAIDLATKSLDKERTARDALISKRNDLATNVSGSFTSDLFGQQPANLSWMNAAQKQTALTQGVFSTLKSDISNANTFKSTLASLKKRGLDGDALASLASSGDMGRAQAFANLSNADLAQYKTLFAQRASAASGVGAFAGNAAFGVQITAQTNAMLSVQAEMKGLRKDLATANKKAKAIHVHDKSGNPKKTARETARRLAMAG